MLTQGARAAYNLALAVLLLTACTAGGGRDAPYRAGEIPGWPRLGAAVPAEGTSYSNASLARLFVTLTHDMEWGAGRPHLVRYEDPVRVSLTGAGSGQYRGFLESYLAMLARETEIDIAAVADTRDANLHVRFVDGPAFARLFPSASCLVVTGEPDWQTYTDAPDRYGGVAMASQPRIEALTIFIPATVEPYLLRGCLIEEIAQALGPANDIYGLGPSIFNDDAAHIWPTRLDLLMLRVLYAPELETGLDRAETAMRARTVLDRENPSGLGAPDLVLGDERRLAGWREVTLGIFSRDNDRTARLGKVREALAIVQETAPGSAHHCQSLTTYGRVLRETDPARALPVLDDAAAICARLHGPDDIRLARIAAERGAALFRLGRGAEALSATEDLERIFAELAQEERLASLYALRAAAFRAIQQGTKAFEARRLANEWGAYALGEDSEVLARWRAGG